MIAWLGGRIKSIGEESIIINTNDNNEFGIGYEVFLTPRIIANFSINSVVELHIYFMVREDILKLYGFADLQEKFIFEKIISISGVGAKAALAILQLGSASDIVNAIYMGDEAFLTRAKGVGKKMAGRIVQELKSMPNNIALASGENINANNTTTAGSIGNHKVNDTIDALMSLGYDPVTARKKTMSVWNDIPNKDEISLEELIKLTLSS